MTSEREIPLEIMMHAERLYDEGGCKSVPTIIAEAILAERGRIIAMLKEEADITPCAEDAMVTRSNARLIEADFSYEEAERLLEQEEA